MENATKMGRKWRESKLVCSLSFRRENNEKTPRKQRGNTSGKTQRIGHFGFDVFLHLREKPGNRIPTQKCVISQEILSHPVIRPLAIRLSRKCVPEPTIRGSIRQPVYFCSCKKRTPLHTARPKSRPPKYHPVLRTVKHNSADNDRTVRGRDLDGIRACRFLGGRFLGRAGFRTGGWFSGRFSGRCAGTWHALRATISVFLPTATYGMNTSETIKN